jgi:adenosylcobinamide-GDP ribazoletransferase
MFCAIPLPYHIWDDGCMDLTLPCFPLIGALIGAIWWGASSLLLAAGVHHVLAAAATAMIPSLASGFLHLDGFMDTCDAVLSRRPLEDKLRILKDPHAGSFSVIMISALLLTQFAAAYAAIQNGGDLRILIAVAVVPRCCSALSVLCLKTMEHSGYAKMLKRNTGLGHKAFLFAVAAGAAAFSIIAAGAGGLIVSLSAAAGSVAAMSYAYKDLKGVSGDLAGFALVAGELCGLVAFACI